MPDILPEPYQLAESPQLAILHALDAVLIATKTALVAAHPELEEEDLCAEVSPRLCADAYIADAVLTNVTALQSAICRYVALVRYRSTPSVPRSNDDF